MIVKIPDYPGKHFSICILTTTSYFCVYLVRPNTWQHTRGPSQGLPAGQDHGHLRDSQEPETGDNLWLAGARCELRNCLFPTLIST